MFRTMGLRHMPVINTEYEIVGMLTRRNFMSIHEHHHTYLPQGEAEDGVDVELAPIQQLFDLDDDDDALLNDPFP